jgi:hypothetical protein
MNMPVSVSIGWVTSGSSPASYSSRIAIAASPNGMTQMSAPGCSDRRRSTSWWAPAS